MRHYGILIALPLPLLLLGTTAQCDSDQRFRIGLNGAYSMGGDVEKPEASYGFQAEWGFNKHWGIELAVSQSSDESTDTGIRITQDLTSVGLSLVGRQYFTENFHSYALVGADYNMPTTDVTLDPGAFGPGWRAAVQMEDAWGWHGALGLGLTLTENVEVFLEYRYTGLEMKGSMTIGDGTFVVQDAIRGHYDFGLLKLGINIMF